MASFFSSGGASGSSGGGGSSSSGGGSSSSGGSGGASGTSLLLTSTFFLNSLPLLCGGLFAPGPLRGLSAHSLTDDKLNGPVQLRAHLPADGRFIVAAGSHGLRSVALAKLQSRPELYLGGLTAAALNGRRVALLRPDEKNPRRLIVQQLQPPGSALNVSASSLFLSAAAAAAGYSPTLSFSELLPAPGEASQLEFWAGSSMMWGSSLFEGPLAEHLNTCPQRGVMLCQWEGGNGKRIRGMFEKKNRPFLLQPKCTAFYHAKFLLLCYPDKLRLCITSANLTEADMLRKSQSLFVQDFAKKRGAAATSGLAAFNTLFGCGSGSGSGRDSGSGTGFEADLVRFLRAAHDAMEPGTAEEKMGKEHFLRFLKTLLPLYEFSNAKVDLLVSMPNEPNEAAGCAPLPRGHLALRKILRDRGAAAGAHCVAQCSSVGSLRAMLPDVVSSMCGGKGLGGGSASASASASASSGSSSGGAHPPLTLIYPSSATVLRSNEGHAGGDVLFPPEKELPAGVLLRAYDACVSGRELAVPHTKFFASCTGGAGGSALQVHWASMGSANLSPSALGGKVSAGGTTIIAAFELGVVFTPEGFLQGMKAEVALLRARRLQPSRFTVGEGDFESVERAASLRFAPQWEQGSGGGGGGGGSVLLVPLPLPFSLPGQGVEADGGLRKFCGSDPLYDQGGAGGHYDVPDAYGKVKSDYKKPGSSDFERCEGQQGAGKRVGTLPPLAYPPPDVPPASAQAGSKRAAQEGAGGKAAKSAKR